MPRRLSLYDVAAQRAAQVMVREYSTSFGMATRLLAGTCRTDICNVYALVRLADEVVDGAAEEAGVTQGAAARDLLDDLERETVAAMERGYSTNLLVHAFARTAREAGIGTDLTAPFFASMRMDLEVARHTAESLGTYIYGSAEVVGLMCLRVFLLDTPEDGRGERYERLTPGARALGAAFQKINFLRDLADDSERLGRSYFVGVDPQHLTEAQKVAVLDDIRADLRVAGAAVPHLPPSARRAVLVATSLFAELTRRLAQTPAEEITRRRVRVPGPVKVRVAARALRSPVEVGA